MPNLNDYAAKLAGCVGKDKFLTKSAAHIVVVRMRNARTIKKQHGKLEVYRCSKCSNYHVGSNLYG